MPGDNSKSDVDFSVAVTETADGVILSIEVSPGSRQEQFPAGYNPWRQSVGISVKAPAMDGKANKAVCALIAERLGVSRQAVSVISGHTSHLKRVLIQGVTAGQIISLL